MTVPVVLDSAGRRRSPATMPGYHAGRPLCNKGMRYPADPPTVEEIVAVMRHAADDRHGWRVRAMIVVLWRRFALSGGARPGGARPRPETRFVAGPQRQGRQAPRGRHGRVGLGAHTPMAHRTGRAGRRAAVLHPRRTRPRATLVRGRGPLRASPARRSGGRKASLCAAPAAPRARAGACPRRRPAQHHPAPTRAHQSRHDLDVPPRYRSEGIIAAVLARRAPMMSASAGLRL
jgi:hypothetical protein